MLELGELLPAAFEPVLEQVGQRDDLDVLALDLGRLGDVLGVVADRRIDHLGRGAQGVQHRAGAASAAADQADLHFDVLRAVGGVDERNLHGRRAGHRQRGNLQKPPARYVRLGVVRHGRSWLMLQLKVSDWDDASRLRFFRAGGDVHMIGSR